MGLWILYLYNQPKQQNPVTEIVRDSIVRDSIYIVNDSIIEKIKYIDKKYDEKVSTIMSSSDSLQYVLFSEYIDCYQRAVKNSKSDIRRTSETVGNCSVIEEPNN